MFGSLEARFGTFFGFWVAVFGFALEPVQALHSHVTLPLHAMPPSATYAPINEILESISSK